MSSWQVTGYVQEKQSQVVWQNMFIKGLGSQNSDSGNAEAWYNFIGFRQKTAYFTASDGQVTKLMLHSQKTKWTNKFAFFAGFRTKLKSFGIIWLVKTKESINYILNSFFSVYGLPKTAPGENLPRESNLIIREPIIFGPRMFSGNEEKNTKFHKKSFFEDIF